MHGQEIACCDVPTWNSTLLDIANEVSNLRALVDARWWSVAGRAMKCGNDSRYAFCPFINRNSHLLPERPTTSHGRARQPGFLGPRQPGSNWIAEHSETSASTRCPSTAQAHADGDSHGERQEPDRGS
ncbi:hypothetical protein TIFTF001_042118 [Ficus carica]|uniref:Uncharacterized protein n=1 Tax=Ficus carica TaxID=3494 RepID=A0AA88A601_FICCA|nr:hypothetical protein TIFTF001_042118 [Ficus carica]